MNFCDLVFAINTSVASDVYSHLEKCSGDYVPPLDSYIDIFKYAEKISNYSVRFEAWHAGILVGLVATYLNNVQDGKGFITNVSVLNQYTGLGIAKHLIKDSITFAKKKGFRMLELEVFANNHSAITLYDKLGFKLIQQEVGKNTMCMYL